MLLWQHSISFLSVNGFGTSKRALYLILRIYNIKYCSQHNSNAIPFMIVVVFSIRKDIPNIHMCPIKRYSKYFILYIFDVNIILLFVFIYMHNICIKFILFIGENFYKVIYNIQLP